MTTPEKIKALCELRRFNQMQLAIERDPVQREALREHIKQVDQDIAKQVKYTAAIIRDPDDEQTQQIPVVSMLELVQGGSR